MADIIQDKVLQDTKNVFDWACDRIMDKPTAKEGLWRCSVCREMVSRNAVEILKDLPVCWACIDERML